MRVPFRRWRKTMMRADSFCEGASSELDPSRFDDSYERLLPDRRHELFCNRRFTWIWSVRKKRTIATREFDLVSYKYPFPFSISLFILFIRIWRFYSNIENFINLRKAICIYSFLKFIHDWSKKGNVFCCYSFLIYIDL